jgi:hypothetical protein
MKAWTVPAVRQVVFADVQITSRQRVAVLPVLGYWSELLSYWLTQNRRCLWLVAHKTTLPGLPGVQFQNYLDTISYRHYFSIYQIEDVLFQLKIKGTSEKFKNQRQRLLRRPRSVNFRQHFQNPSRKTVPLNTLCMQRTINLREK